MDPAIHDQRDPLDQFIGRCMICGISSSPSGGGRTLSHYNRSTTICLICSTVEGAVLIQHEDALSSPKILWSEWKDMIMTKRQEITKFVGKSYIRKGHSIHPTPSRHDVILWVKWLKAGQNSQNGIIHK